MRNHFYGLVTVAISTKVNLYWKRLVEIYLSIDALHKLPPPAAGEDRDLAAFRAELREELRARWEIFIPYFDPDSPKEERNPKVLRERARFFAR